MPSKVFFDVQQLYYFPQYLPVFEELQRRGVECRFILYRQEQIAAQLQELVTRDDWPIQLVDPDQVAAIYATERPDWVIFGNHSPLQTTLPQGTKSALVYHGIGIKECYYDPRLAEMDVRFVEGPFRLQELQRRYPGATFVNVGFPKLDPLFRQKTSPGPANQRKVLLYAPTFYPSSIELMPRDWPALLAECDILVKPHFFSMTMPNYKRQRRILQEWAERYSNVTLAGLNDFSLVPYMERADLLISEASSALFEFAVLNRPVVWLDFFKLRWTYRGLFRFRFNRRMDQTILRYADIAAHVAKPADLPRIVRQELAVPDRLSELRRCYTAELIGSVDGMAADRIADYLLSPSPKTSNFKS